MKVYFSLSFNTFSCFGFASRMIVMLLLIAAFSLDCPGAVLPSPPQQQERKVFDSPLYLSWHVGLSQKFERHLQLISEQAGIANDINAIMERLNQADQHPIDGQVAYLVQSPNGTVGTSLVKFQEIPDGLSLTEFIKQHGESLGEQPSEITGTEDFKKVSYEGTYKSPSFEKQTEVNEDGITVESWVPAKDKDGKPVTTDGHWSYTQYFRLEDGVVFSSQLEELQRIRLPSAKKLGLTGDDRDLDFLLYADLKSIPAWLKSFAWKQLSVAAYTQMQKQDGESQVAYDLRESVDSFRMNMLRTLFDDVESVTAKVALGEFGEPVRASIDVTTAGESDLSKLLKSMNRPTTLLPPDSDSAISLNSAWTMPQECQAVLTAASRYVKSLGQDAETPAETATSLQQIATALDEISRRGIFELAVHLGGTKASGPVLHGAILANKCDGITAGLKTLLARLPLEQTIIKDFVSSSGSQYLQVDLPASLPATHLYLRFDQEMIRFSAGKEAAWEILEQAPSEGTSIRNTRASLAKLVVNMERFLNSEDPAGLDDFGKQVDLAFDKFFTNDLENALDRSKAEIQTPQTKSLLGVTLENYSSRLSISVNSDSTGIYLRAKAEEAIGRYISARLLSAINRLKTLQQAGYELERQEERQLRERQ